jgi:hypothetical protein
VVIPFRPWGNYWKYDDVAALKQTTYNSSIENVLGSFLSRFDSCMLHIEITISWLLTMRCNRIVATVVLLVILYYESRINNFSTPSLPYIEYGLNVFCCTSRKLLIYQWMRLLTIRVTSVLSYVKLVKQYERNKLHSLLVTCQTTYFYLYWPIEKLSHLGWPIIRRCVMFGHFNSWRRVDFDSSGTSFTSFYHATNPYPAIFYVGETSR